jgi:peptidoglycan/xylan/chitin deacetylase (PgdA/CDA1 family)
MSVRENPLMDFTPSRWTAAISWALALVLLAVDWHLSLVVLATYAVACAMAPFIPSLGFFLPVTSRGCPGRQSVALTFDDGPDPLVTPAVLEMLKERQLQATFFVCGAKATRNPHLVEAITDYGHTIGNHGYHHDPLIFFKGAGAIFKEIDATQQALKPFGIQPRIYRPPAGILAPSLRQPLNDTGLRVVNFSCRGFDRGNKRIRGLAARIIRRVQPGDIILLHDILPNEVDGLRIWLEQLRFLLDGLSAKGLVIEPLEDLIGFPVMASNHPQHIARA